MLLPGSLLAQSDSTFNTLSIPPLASGELRGGARHYDLRTQNGSSDFIGGMTTPTLGINGNYLGPTLRLRNGDDVALNVRNQMDEATTLHWHGLHVPAIADGGPHQLIQPGEDWRAEFTVRQQAGSFWYHSHMLGRTGEQVYRGLAGMVIIDDEDLASSTLPNEYGVDDIPLVVQDRRFNEDGSFAYVRNHRDIMTGFFGDTILVNGTYQPLFTPSTGKVRFRLLNGANARTFVFAFDDERQFNVVSSDGSMLAAPLALSRIMLAPSERADIVVDFTDGQPCNLISEPMPADSVFAPQGMMRRMHPTNTETLQILAIEPESNLVRSQELAPTLASVVSIPESEAVRRRTITLSMMMGMMGGRMRGGGRGGDGGNRGGGSMMNMGGGNFFINDQAMDMTRIDYRIPVGDTEIWEISNDSMMMHPFHIHHNQFQILSRNGQAPALDESGFKDTVKIGPGETVRFIMRFENFADAEHPYMFHCHILEHEDNGMMGQFTVE